MMTADVLLLSKSSFSLVPAILNRDSQVMYTPFWHAALPNWTTVDESILKHTYSEMERLQQKKHCKTSRRQRQGDKTMKGADSEK
jgi:hypothetical protein